MNTAREISRRLSERVESVCHHLLPGGKRQGSEWCVGSVDGEPGLSCKIHLAGEKSGVWSDFASGEAGDLLDLWCKVKGVSIGDAVKQAKAFMGITDKSFETTRKKNFTRPEKPKCEKAKEGTVAGNYLIGNRNLLANTLEAYKVAFSGDNIVFPYLRQGELVFFKQMAITRVGGKKKITASKDSEPCLFGWQAIDSKSRFITICEGEIDAMTCYQYGFPALSVPFGGGAGAKHAWIEYEFDNLSVFDDIYLCFDSDEEGEKAIKDVSERLGRHRCRIVRLPYKDANECLKNSVSKSDFFDLFMDAKTLDPDGLRPAYDYTKEVANEFYPIDGDDSKRTPFNSANDKIKFRKNELSIWTGTSGHGKTTMLNQFMIELMKQDQRVCIASLEVKPRKLISRMVRQITGDSMPSANAIAEQCEWLGGKLWMFDYVGSAKTEHILSVFEYARLRYGIDHFVLDSLMKCGLAEDDYNGQKLFIEKLCDFKTKHDVHIHLVAHARKGQNEDAVPGKLDVKGTGTITDMADNCFTVWRNKAKYNFENDLTDHERAAMCDAILYCDKQKNGEWEGRIKLWWNGDGQSYTDNQPDTEPQPLKIRAGQSYVERSFLDNN